MALANSHQKLRLLFLLPFAPRLDASHGGGRAIAQLLMRLAARHWVALLYLRAAHEPPLDETLQGQCDLVEEIIRPIPDQATKQLWAWRIQLIKSLLNNKPIWVTEWAVTAFGLRATAIAKTWQPDLVQLEYHLMAQYTSALDDCRVPQILVEHEPGIKAAPYLQASHPAIRQVMHCFDRRAWKRYETSIIKKSASGCCFYGSRSASLSLVGAIYAGSSDSPGN